MAGDAQRQGETAAERHDLAGCLGLGIHLAKIATEGTRVVDVFYVSEPDGKKVEPGRARDIETELLGLIAGLA